MPYVAFEKLTDTQRSAVRAKYQGWKDEEFPWFEFYIRKDGILSAAKGAHRITMARVKQLEKEWIDQGMHLRVCDVKKGSLYPYVTATFHLNRE